VSPKHDEDDPQEKHLDAKREGKRDRERDGWPFHREKAFRDKVRTIGSVNEWERRASMESSSGKVPWRDVDRNKRRLASRLIRRPEFKPSPGVTRLEYAHEWVEHFGGRLERYTEHYFGAAVALTALTPSKLEEFVSWLSTQQTLKAEALAHQGQVVSMTPRLASAQARDLAA
jgi:hypothetical protein